MKNRQSPEDITTEDLKVITQAPSIHEPLVSEEEFPVEFARSRRPVWTKPVPKLVVIGSVLIPVFGTAALLLVNGGHSKQAQKASVKASLTPEATSHPESASDEMARLRQENGKLKANAAIGDQNNLQNRSASGKRDLKPPRIATKPPTESAKAPQLVTVAAAAPQMISRPNPPRMVAAPVSLPQVSAIPVRNPVVVKSETPVRSTAVTATPDIDPIQQWQQLAQLGSYGSRSAENSTVPEWSSASRQTSSSSTVDSETPLKATPTAYIASTSAIQTSSESDTASDANDQTITTNNSNRMLGSDSPSKMEKPTLEETQSEIDQLTAFAPTVSSARQVPILDNAEAAILQEQARQHALIAGESKLGILTMPLIINDGEGNALTGQPKQNQFTIVLAQPLIDSTGQVAMPTGTQLLAQVDNFSQTGHVQLSATTAVWIENGLKKELTLPKGVIQVRGENGQPLVAKQFEDRGRAIAAMDAGQFLFGAMRRSAQLFTRSNSQIQTGNGTTIITENNPSPNLLAGVLEGGTDAVLASIQERNKQAIKEIEQRPNLRFIESGKPVQVFVNQSMLLPD